MFTPVIITKVYILDKLAASLLACSKKLGLLGSTRRVGVPRRDREVQIETMSHIAQNMHMGWC